MENYQGGCYYECPTSGEAAGLFNLIENGDFSNGLSGWEAGGGGLLEGQGYAVSLGDGTAASVSLEHNLCIYKSLDKVFVIAAAVEPVNLPHPLCSINFVMQGSGGPGFTMTYLKTGGIEPKVRYTLYKAFTQNILTSVVRVQLRHTYLFSNYAKDSIVKFSNIMLLEGSQEDLKLMSAELAEKYPF